MGAGGFNNGIGQALGQAQQRSNAANQAFLNAITGSVGKSAKQSQAMYAKMMKQTGAATNLQLSQNAEEQQATQGKMMAQAAGGGMPISAVQSYTNQNARNANMENQQAQAIAQNQRLGILGQQANSQQDLGQQWRSIMSGVQNQGPDLNSLLPFLMQAGQGQGQGGGGYGGAGSGIIAQLLQGGYGLNGSVPKPNF
jgi:hypothetical protein